MVSVPEKISARIKNLNMYLRMENVLLEYSIWTQGEYNNFYLLTIFSKKKDQTFVTYVLKISKYFSGRYWKIFRGLQFKTTKLHPTDISLLLLKHLYQVKKSLY